MPLPKAKAKIAKSVKSEQNHNQNQKLELFQGSPSPGSSAAKKYIKIILAIQNCDNLLKWFFIVWKYF